MQTFSHIVDFNQYKIGEQFREFLTPGSANPGAVVQDDEGKGLYWTGTTWLSYIRAWADLAATGSATVTGGKVTSDTGLEITTRDYTKPLKFGAYCLWVSSTGKLYIKSTAPASDTDGTVVGTQT